MEDRRERKEIIRAARQELCTNRQLDTKTVVEACDGMERHANYILSSTTCKTTCAAIL